jgi:hypothetical protein
VNADERRAAEVEAWIARQLANAPERLDPAIAARVSRLLFGDDALGASAPGSSS